MERRWTYHHKDEFSVNGQSTEVCLFVLHQVEVSTNDIQICASDITIQHMASFYGYRGEEGNLGKTSVIVLNLQVWSHSLSPKGECQVGKLVMFSKEALDNGFQKKKTFY